MIGCKEVKPVSGSWTHHGYMTTEHVFIPGSTICPRGTFLMASPTDDTKAVLASGDAVGFITQELDNYGQLSDAARLRAAEGVGKMPGDWPVRRGSDMAITCRRMHDGGQVEFEGSGVAAPGNVVCTSGTGSLSTGTTRKTELSLHNGCIRVAQTGDKVIMSLLQANLTPETAGRLRIRVEFVGRYIKA